MPKTSKKTTRSAAGKRKAAKSRKANGKARKAGTPRDAAHMKAMSAARIASGRVGGRPTVFTQPRPGWSKGTIEQLACDGVERVDIVELLQIGPILTTDSSKRQEFDKLVSMGHSIFKVKLQSWLVRAATKGQSNSIKSLATVWISRFGDEAEQGEWKLRTDATADNIMGLIAKHKKRAKERVT